MAAAGFFRRQGVKVVDFWKGIADDYWSVVKNAAEESKKKPWKAVLAGTVTAGLTYAYHTNPDELSMLNDLRERRQQMALIPSTIHNTSTDDELNTRTRLLNQKRLHHYNFLFFSLLVKGDHDENVRIYSSQDTNVNEWWVKAILKNVIDIGFMGKWYHLENKFQDYDVNGEEFHQIQEIVIR